MSIPYDELEKKASLDSDQSLQLLIKIIKAGDDAEEFERIVVNNKVNVNAPLSDENMGSLLNLAAYWGRLAIIQDLVLEFNAAFWDFSGLFSHEHAKSIDVKEGDAKGKSRKDRIINFLESQFYLRKLIKIIDDGDNAQSFDERVSTYKKVYPVLVSAVFNDYDETLLHYAASKGRENIIKSLVFENFIKVTRASGGYPHEYAEKITVQPENKDLDEQKKRITQFLKNEFDLWHEDGFFSKDKLASLPERPWLDIPFAKEANVTHPKMIRLLDKYHSLPKTDKRSLKDRIVYLRAMLALCDGLLAEAKLKGIPKKEIVEIEALKKAAFGKERYLIQLQKMVDQKYWGLDLVFGDIENGALLRTLRFDEYGKEMNADKMNFDVGIAAPFFDPCLRAGFRSDSVEFPNNLKLFYLLHEEWNKEYNAIVREDEEKGTEKARTFPSFYLWLEGKDKRTAQFDPNTKQQAVELLELRNCRVTNGIIHLRNDKLKRPLTGVFSCVMNRKGELFLSKMDTWADTPNHPNIHFGFSPIIFAGRLSLKEGKVLNFDNFSGHYEPKPIHCALFVRALEQQQCLDKNCTAEVYYRTFNGTMGCEQGKVKEINFERLIRATLHLIEDKASGKKLRRSTKEICDETMLLFQAKAAVPAKELAKEGSAPKKCKIIKD